MNTPMAKKNHYEYLSNWVLLNSGQDLLAELKKKNLFVFLIGTASGHFTTATKKIAIFAYQVDLLLVRTLHLAFPNLNAYEEFKP